MKIQVIKVDLIHEAVLEEPGSCVTAKFADVGVQPDGLAQIESIADFIQCMKDFVCAGVFAVVTDSDVFY